MPSALSLVNLRSCRLSRPYAAVLCATLGFAFANQARAQTPAPPAPAPAPPVVPTSGTPAETAPPAAPPPAAPTPAPVPTPDSAASVPPPSATTGTPADAPGPDVGTVAPAPAEPTASAIADDDPRVAAALAELPADVEVDQYGLNLYGFADFAYAFDLGETATGPSSFSIGNLNLYAEADLGENWRSLFEVRFMYLPHGTTPLSFDPASPAQRTDTTVPDYADISNPTRWGGISIQRAWLEHQFHPGLTLRGGHFLTPYGIWNVDHGSPVVIPVRRPFNIGSALLPQSQTGLEAHGHFGFGPAEVGYHLTLSNGRGPIDTYQDLDNNKAVGGRLYGKLDTSAGVFTLGVSGYRGRYTDSETQFAIVDGEFRVVNNVTSRYEELSLATDFKWLWEGFHFQAEAILNDVSYDESTRPVDPALFGGPPGFSPDYRRWGAYALAGYRTDFVGLMPFVVLETYDPGLLTGFAPISSFWVGLNARPTPRVVLKANLVHVWPSQVRGLPEGESINFLDTQAAWSF